MLDPVIEFFTRIFQLIGRGVGMVIAWLLWPFMAIARWYNKTHGILKVLAGILILLIMIPYAWFFWNAAFIRNFDINYTRKLHFEELKVAAGDQVAIEGGQSTTKTCGRSALVDVAAELIDFNVNQNNWMSGTLLYKIGLFGLDWDATPWFDNKASFQRGVHRSVRRVTVELADVMGRVRGTSQINHDLERARNDLNIREFNWYWGTTSPYIKQTSWGSYRQARRELVKYNDDLAACKATFDARADNLMQFLDRIAKDIGSTSAEIKDRAEKFNGGWFDTRADNVWMDAMGELYAYYGLIQAARSDFRDIIEKRALTDIWENMESQLKSALELDPLIISNGTEDGFMMPTHLTTVGFYILRVRSNLVEVRSVLDR